MGQSQSTYDMDAVVEVIKLSFDHSASSQASSQAQDVASALQRRTTFDLVPDPLSDVLVLLTTMATLIMVVYMCVFREKFSTLNSEESHLRKRMSSEHFRRLTRPSGNDQAEGSP